MQQKRRKKLKRIKKKGVIRRVNILYKFIECIFCKNRYCNGIKGLVIGTDKDIIEILTIFGDIVKIKKSECWYYVRLGNIEYLLNPRQVV